MKIRNFRPIDLPIQWREYYTKYPHGMTIFESLVQWVNSVNDMVENMNDLNHYMNDFINQWQGEMKDEVTTTLQEWEQSGYLEEIIGYALGSRMDKIEDIIGINVEDFPMLEGEVDDTARIQRALDTLENGGILNFNEGVFIYGDGDITIDYDNVTIRGMGRNTIIKFKNRGKVLNGGFYIDAKSNISFENLTFDGNNDNQIHKHVLIRFRNVDKPQVINCHFEKAFGRAVAISGCKDVYMNNLYFADITGEEGGPGNAIYGQDIKGGNISNVLGERLGDHLVYIDSSHSYTENINFTNCTGKECGMNGLTNGVVFNVCNDSRNISFVNCHAIDSRGGFYFHENGVTGKSPRDYRLINCTVRGGNFGGGFRFYSHGNVRSAGNVKVIGCSSLNNQGLGTAVGFGVKGLQNVEIIDSNASNNSDRGVTIENCSDVVVRGCVLLENVTLSGSVEISVIASDNVCIADSYIKNKNVESLVAIGNDSTEVCLINNKIVPERVIQNHGIYKPLTDRILLGVVANSGNGDVTIRQGSEYVDSVVSSQYGLDINLKNLPATVTPFVNIAYGGSKFDGIEYEYPRTMTNTKVTIGLKETPTSAHKPLSGVDSGFMSIEITL